MPNFKKEGRGFKMKGFTAFTKKVETPRKTQTASKTKKASKPLWENMDGTFTEKPKRRTGTTQTAMSNRKNKNQLTPMKKYGKSPMKKDDDKSKKLESTKETKLLQKKNESMMEFHDRLKKLGFNKQASEVKAKMDKAYETADWDKE